MLERLQISTVQYIVTVCVFCLYHVRLSPSLANQKMKWFVFTDNPAF